MAQIKDHIRALVADTPNRAGEVYLAGHFYTADEVLAFGAHLVSLANLAKLEKERVEAEKKKKDYLPYGTIIAVVEGVAENLTAIKTAEYGWVRTNGNREVNSDDRLFGQDDSHWVKVGIIIYQPSE